MIRSKTVFVVGAGASAELGLPIGRELTDRIAKALNIKFPDGYTQKTGDMHIMEALRRVAPLGNEINEYLHVAWQIAEAMPQAASIDNYIDAHQGNARLELCGKLAIVRCILLAEQSSLLYVDPRTGGRIDFKKLSKSWLNSFVQLAAEDCRLSTIDQIFSNVSFICFNYDRCIEEYLYHALCNYYRITGEKAAELMNALPIFHPYGVVGKLSWQTKSNPTPFGASDQGARLLELTEGIKTFTEQIQEEATLTRLKHTIRSADRIVFLGFAFHRQNMRLLDPKTKTNVTKVFATAKGISTSDCNVIHSLLKNTVRSEKDSTGRGIKINNNLTCSALFQEFWRSLSD